MRKYFDIIDSIAWNVCIAQLLQIFDDILYLQTAISAEYSELDVSLYS